MSWISPSLTPLSATALILTREPRLDGGVDPVHHLGEAAPAGDRTKAFRIEGVERHVHAPDAAGREFVREAAELGAVGGERELLEPRRFRGAAPWPGRTS
jgi:hypothetical protein